MSYFFLPHIQKPLSNVLSNETIKMNKTEHTITAAYDIYKENVSNMVVRDDVLFCRLKKLVHYYNPVLNSVNDLDHEIKYISIYKAMTPSYYLMIEIQDLLDVLDTYKHQSIHTFHMSKCNPGIIEAIDQYRNQHSKDKHTCIYSDVWKDHENYLEKNKNINFDDNLSYNIFNLEHLAHSQKHNYRQYDFITFFDDCENAHIDIPYDNVNICDIVCLKVIYAVVMQKLNGTLIFKIPNTTTRIYHELLFILSILYQKVVIMKPHVSDLYTSEKFVICKQLLPHGSLVKLYDFGISIIFKVTQREKEFHLTNLIGTDLPLHFMNRINECNVIIGQQQLDVMNNVNIMMNTPHMEEKLHMLTKRASYKSTQWCQKHQIPYTKL